MAIYQQYSSGSADVWLVDFGYRRCFLWTSGNYSFPEEGITWLYIVPPLLILLTRYGIPVSTTFLVLTIFSPSSLGSMLTKSMMGYAVAFIVAILVYRFVIKRISVYFSQTRHHPTPKFWIGLQWVSTAFLWSQWLIQDLANILSMFPVWFLLVL